MVPRGWIFPTWLPGPFGKQLFPRSLQKGGKVVTFATSLVGLALGDSPSYCDLPPGFPLIPHWLRIWLGCKGALLAMGGKKTGLHFFFRKVRVGDGSMGGKRQVFPRS